MGEIEYLDFDLSECRLYPEAVDVLPNYWCGQYQYGPHMEENND